MAANFAAIDPYIETNIVSPREKKMSGRDYVMWGDGNAYPDYIASLLETVPTLASIVNGSADFAAGDDCSLSVLGGRPNRTGESVHSLVRDLSLDYYGYGGFALQVIRNNMGDIAEIHRTAARFLRSNETATMFYYNEEWDRRASRYVEIPAFRPEDRAVATSILFVRNTHMPNVYPLPVYATSVKACELERSIDEYHLYEINNGFAPSVMISFNNGIPSDDVKQEIERTVVEKFSGKKNAGRILLAWNDGVQNRATIQQMSVSDFGQKYESLAKRSRQQIFTAFRANPNLFGIPTESLGFSEEEYAQAFKLYNRTSVRPVQRRITDAFDYIFGAQGVLTITPFSLETAGESNVR